MDTYTEEHQWTTSDLLDDVDGDERGQEVFSSVASSHQLRGVTTTETNICVQNRSLYPSKLAIVA
jgi:hypothetical protein